MRVNKFQVVHPSVTYSEINVCERLKIGYLFEWATRGIDFSSERPRVGGKRGRGMTSFLRLFEQTKRIFTVISVSRRSKKQFTY